MRAVFASLVSAFLLGIGLWGCAQHDVAVGPLEGGGHLVSTRHVLRPAGRSIEFGGRPVDLLLSPDGERLVVKDHRGLVFIDVATWCVTQELPFTGGQGGSMHGLAQSRHGRRIYATTAQNKLFECVFDAQGQARWARDMVLAGPGGSGNSHATGITLSEDEGRAYVCLSINNPTLTSLLRRISFKLDMGMDLPSGHRHIDLFFGLQSKGWRALRATWVICVHPSMCLCILL